MSLPASSVFGDYAVLFGLVSNILMRSQDFPESADGRGGGHAGGPLRAEDRQSRFMCCRSEVFRDLCELYPETRERVKEMALLKRELYLHFRTAANEMRSSHSGQPRMDSPRGGTELGRAVLDEEFESHYGSGHRRTETKEDRLRIASMNEGKYSDKDLNATTEEEMSKEFRLERNKYLLIKSLNYQGCKILKEIVQQQLDINKMLQMLDNLKKGVYNYEIPENANPEYFHHLPQFLHEEGKP